MKRVIFLVAVVGTVLCFSLSIISYACEGDSTPKPIYPDDAESHNYITQFKTGIEQPTAAQLNEKKIAAEKGDFHNQNEYAAALAQSGDLKQAREILERLAIEQPEEYSVAANL